jgi:acetyltransferase-like isoleucine patch superfamily enzyme
VGEACHICPGVVLAGRVRVGAGAMLGIGAKVLPCLNIGEHATIGAGAVVTRDVPPGVTVVGVPAHPMRKAA